ncbi:MAG: carbamoyltransferase C-terminal domain-containing protein [Crinalium sp.]
MTVYHLGLNLGHDRAAAIVADGEIVVAIEQERLDRHKHSVGFMLQAPGVADQIQVPHESIRYCLDACNIDLSDLASITPNMPGRDFAPDILRRVLPKEFATKVNSIPSHHLAHAYSAFWPSGFEEALILVVDATGSTSEDRRTESYTLYEGRGQTISTLHSETVAAHLAGISTLGFIYEYIARKVGFVSKISNSFSYPEAGKLMGLAPYGKEQPNLHPWIRTKANSYSLEISAYDIFLEVAAIEKYYDTKEGLPYLRPYLVDLAYKVQTELEKALVHIVSLAVKETGLRKLCIAGGVGLNAVANYQILQQLELDDVFIFPAAGDNGIAAGCAYWAYNTIDGGQKRPKLVSAALGRRYSQDRVTQALAKFASDVEIEELIDTEIIRRSAEAIAKGNIVARFEGGCEYGPRALGNRSIIVDPTFERMKDILNSRVKFREPFRPFAPVIPVEDLNQVFDLKVAAPFMLLIAPIKPEYQKVLPAANHVDGTGRVQTVTEQDNNYFYHICKQLTEIRQGPPVLLNTSFNVAGQPIVETPEEAIETFLSTDIDYLAIENFWISKRSTPIRSYQEHLAKVVDQPMPQALSTKMPDVTDLMEKLDQAIFLGENTGCPWTTEELQKLSNIGAQYKETSILFPDTPFYAPLRTQLSKNVVLLLDPLSKSTLVDLQNQVQPTTYTLDEVKFLLALLDCPPEEMIQKFNRLTKDLNKSFLRYVKVENDLFIAIFSNIPEQWQEQMRIELGLTNFEFKQRLKWAVEQLKKYNLQPQQNYLEKLPKPNELTSLSEQTLAPFAQPDFDLRAILQNFQERLFKANYTDSNICGILGVQSQQLIEPTYFFYYDQYLLPHTDIGDLIRLFLIQASLPEMRVRELFGEELFTALMNLGVLINRGEEWRSQIDIYCQENIYIATDHRFLLRKEDKLNEEQVTYIGLDSTGLVNTAPRHRVNHVLDLCCGAGIQGLMASRYANFVTSVDINERAIRFARFNAQLNGIENIQFHLGNLYEPVKGYLFNTILANPPFVASPDHSLLFRDGGFKGEEILAHIIKGSAEHLAPDGRLFIVSDLVDVDQYEAKLEKWWIGGAADKLVLSTGDRDTMLFNVPHAHAPFNQSFDKYNSDLDKWLTNFQKNGIRTINFGYILICRLPANQNGSYYRRTIHNPLVPIHQQVKQYFTQRTLVNQSGNSHLFLNLNPDIRFRREINPTYSTSKENNIEIFAVDNPYFTTYKINEKTYQLMIFITQFQPDWSSHEFTSNRAVICDLIYKGVLYLSHRPPHNVEKQMASSQAAPDIRPTIVEVATKTTPTCISPYLAYS